MLRDITGPRKHMTGAGGPELVWFMNQHFEIVTCESRPSWVQRLLGLTVAIWKAK